MRARVSVLTLTLVTLPSIAAAQTWPVQGNITVQTQVPPPPPPDVQVQVQAPPPPQSQPVVAQPALPPPPPPGPVLMQQPMVLQQPSLGYNLVYGPDPETAGARVQLVVGQGINGMGLGVCLMGVIRADRAAYYSGALLLGGGIGAVAALLATRDGVTTGQAAVINNSTLFGGAVAGYTLFGLNGSRMSEQAIWGVLGAGLLVGTGAGIAVATQKPLSGRVEFASSMGLWSAFLAGHLYFATRGYGTMDSGSSRDSLAVFGWSSLGMMVAGVTAGALAAPSFPISAARMRWINLSGLGGWAILGLSSMLLASDRGSSEDTATAYGIGSLVGAAGGLVLGYFLTSNVDSAWERGHGAEARNRVLLSPGGPGGAPGLSLSGTF